MSLKLQMLWKEITIEHTGQYYCCVVTMSVTDEMNIAMVTWAEQSRLRYHKEKRIQNFSYNDLKKEIIFSAHFIHPE